MKLQRIPFVLMIIVGVFMSACTDTDDSTTTSKTTTITRFYLKNDSVTGLNKTVFTIDNDSNVIYNVDSLPYLSDVDSVIPSIYSAITLSAVYLNDTTLYTGKDTLDFTKPVKITTIATDKKTTRTYTVKVNVHQVDPDLYEWEGIKSEIYQGATVEQKALLFSNTMHLFVKTTTEFKRYESVDGKSWTESTVTGLPLASSLKGIITTKDEMLLVYNQELYRSTNGSSWSKLTSPTVQLTSLLFSMNNKVYALGTTDGSNRIMFESSDKTNWVNLGVAPENFPVSGFSVWVDAAPSGKMQAFIVGGRSAQGTLLSSVWSTENGSYWANLTAEKEWFTPREEAAVVQYGGGLMLIGGKNDSGTLTDTQWVSPDYGLSWKAAEEKAQLPDLYIPRFGQSIIVDKDNYIYLIGGQTSSTFLKDVWKGRKNSAIPGFLD